MQEVLQSRAAPFLQSLHLIMSLACMLQGNAQLLWTSALHLSQLQVAQSPLMQSLGQQEETVLVSLLVLQKLWQQLLRTWDWQPSHWPGGRLQLLLHAAATMGVQLALHSDGQSLHSGFSLGCPCEDMTSTARTAMAATALRHDPPETIRGWIDEARRGRWLEQESVTKFKM
jgi:hypothetical protein